MNEPEEGAPVRPDEKCDPRTRQERRAAERRARKAERKGGVIEKPEGSSWLKE